MRKTFLTVVVLTMLAALSSADEPAPPRVPVLDTCGVWRVLHVLAPPVVKTDEGLKTILATDQPWLHETSPEPPADWRGVDFDDHAWLRGPVRIACETSMISRMCFRGKFSVTDPAKAKDVRLTLGYYGGAIVTLNGTEFARGHIGPDGLAEVYPENVYYFGERSSWGWLVGKRYEWEKKRTRTFDDLVIPAKLLRKGVNVLAIEIVRSPHNKAVMVNEEGRRYKRKTPVDMNWPTCSLRYVRLTAKTADGIVPNAVRPAGLQVWNSDLLAADFDLDFGDATETARPIEIVGARNGSFSGKIGVGCDGPLKKLEATIGPLTGPGTIRPASVRIRYGIPWGEDADAMWRYTLPAAMLGALEEAPLDEAPVTQRIVSPYYGLKIRDPLDPVIGVTRTVWVTVDVPKDAAPGLYEGTLTVGAEGQRPVAVPVRLDVADWTLPDSDDYTTWVELMQSTDTLAIEYGVEPWSVKHWTHIERSMDHLNRIGSRILYIPVICRTNLGNEESMVRWIAKADGTYDWDFSLMDRYLDTAAKRMGKPKVVCLWVWEKFMFPTIEDPKTFEEYYPGREGVRDETGAKDYIGKGPLVTIVDPKSGKRENRHLPYLLDPKSKPIWKAFFEKARKRLDARGLADKIMLGTPSDVVLRKEHFAFFNEAAPGLRWVNHSHMELNALYKNAGAKLGYYTTVFGGNFFPEYPVSQRHYGWKREEFHAYLLRNWHRSWDQFPVASWHHLGEVNITGEQRGIGHLGAEFWPVVKDKRGSRVGRVYLRYPECNWRSNDICTALLAPGATGPVATHRYEAMREGVQACEARVSIERALLDEKHRARLGGDLAKRCQDALDERIRFMLMGMSDLEIDSSISGAATNAYSTWWNRPGIEGHKWFVASGWQERSRTLYALAGEVARKLKAH